jgi:hypothetical protein
MKPTLAVALGISIFSTGCSHFGYYKHEKPEWAPPEEGAKVQFLNSLEGGVQLSGPMMVALNAAMKDFRPPSISPQNEDSPEGKCLARWDFFQTTIFRANDNLFFVLFIPDLSQCGPGFVVLDAGAEYAIDGTGRILAKQ